jgi:hypothetical protein
MQGYLFSAARTAAEIRTMLGADEAATNDLTSAAR